MKNGEQTKPSPQEFLRQKYHVVDFHDLAINGKSWLALMDEYALLIDDNDRANYYEDKIDMLNRHLKERDEQIFDFEWQKKIIKVTSIV